MLSIPIHFLLSSIYICKANNNLKFAAFLTVHLDSLFVVFAIHLKNKI